MSATEYHFTPNISGNLQVVCLTESGLTSVYGGNATLLPFERITEVRLWFNPSRFDRERFCCEVKGTPALAVVFQSTTCEGLGQFTPQSDGYRAFVLALHQRLSGLNPRVNFMTGVSGMRYAVNVGCLAIGMGMLAFAILTVGFAALGPGALIPLALIAFYTPTAWQWLRRNKSRSYNPLAVPDDLLPLGNTIAISTTSQSPPPLPTSSKIAPSSAIEQEVERFFADPRVSGEPPPSGGRWYDLEDFGPIAEPGDHSWMSVAGNTTHWADATRYAEEANEKLKAGLIGPPLDPPPHGEQPL